MASRRQWWPLTCSMTSFYYNNKLTCSIFVVVNASLQALGETPRHGERRWWRSKRMRKVVSRRRRRRPLDLAAPGWISQSGIQCCRCAGGRTDGLASVVVVVATGPPHWIYISHLPANLACCCLRQWRDGCSCSCFVHCYGQQQLTRVPGESCVYASSTWTGNIVRGRSQST